MARGRCSVCRQRGHNRSAHTPAERRVAAQKFAAEQAVHLAGVRATWSGICPRCGCEVHGAQVVKTSRGDWICSGCASGADDT